MAKFRRGPPNGGVECRWGKSAPFNLAHPVHSAVTDHGELMTLVAGKRRSLLIAGDDDEVYDKKHQRYAEDNGRAFKF